MPGIMPLSAYEADECNVVYLNLTCVFVDINHVNCAFDAILMINNCEWELLWFLEYDKYIIMEYKCESFYV